MQCLQRSIKISALSSDEIDKYEYLSGGEILRSNRSRIIEEAKLAYYSLGESRRKTKATEEYNNTSFEKKVTYCFQIKKKFYEDSH